MEKKTRMNVRQEKNEVRKIGKKTKSQRKLQLKEARAFSPIQDFFRCVVCSRARSKENDEEKKIGLKNRMYLLLLLLFFRFFFTATLILYVSF